MNGHHERVARSSRPRQNRKTTTAYAPAWFERHFVLLLEALQAFCDVTGQKQHFLRLFHSTEHQIHEIYEALSRPRNMRVLHWYRSVNAICEHCRLHIKRRHFVRVCAVWFSFHMEREIAPRTAGGKRFSFRKYSDFKLKFCMNLTRFCRFFF